MRTLAYAVVFAIAFGVVGAIGGFIVGLGLSTIDEIVLHKGNPQGPLLFIFAATLCVVFGLAYGIAKGMKS
jgi:hypothetical protein